MKINVLYFALMREQAGRAQEFLDTAATTPAELFAQLSATHDFSLGVDQLKVAVNNEFGTWSQALSDGDTVVFIPPVAGG